MKKTDIALIVLIVGLSAGVAYVVANSLFGNINEQGAKIQTIDPINSSVEEPDEAIFNDQAINPAVEVQIESTDTPDTQTDTTDTTDTSTDSNR